MRQNTLTIAFLAVVALILAGCVTRRETAFIERTPPCVDLKMLEFLTFYNDSLTLQTWPVLQQYKADIDALRVGQATAEQRARLWRVWKEVTGGVRYQ